MAEQHPIQGLMYSSMQSIKEMIDVNTIVGDAVETADGTTIIPISKVSFGFGVGGTEFFGKKENVKSTPNDNSMFGGGSGAGVAITPIAFMVVGNGQIRLLPVAQDVTTVDKLIDAIPSAIDRIVDGVKKITPKKAAPVYAQTDNGEEIKINISED